MVYTEEDYVFMRDLGEGPRVPTSNDWANVSSCIDSVLKECLASEDNDLKKMAMKMKLKFDKYWGDIKKFNLLVFIASVFNSRTKMKYLQVTLNGMYGDDEGPKVAEFCEKALIALFNDYKRIYSNQNARSVSSSSSDDATQSFSINQSVTDRGLFGNSKSELDRYLTEEIEGDEAYFKSGDFTVLETVQALICYQDWVRLVDVAVNLEENIDDLEKFEDGSPLSRNLFWKVFFMFRGGTFGDSETGSFSTIKPRIVRKFSMILFLVLLIGANTVVIFLFLGLIG
nr:zinc finger BED domain-containing protein RICESLEEPER 2-like [Tanacetum cinerariifolium]